MKRNIVLLLITLVFCSCSEYQKALKSEDSEFKNNEAVKQYNSGKYSKAIRLFEQIAPSFRGKPQSEEMFYMFSQSYYKTNQFYLSGDQFERFVSSYPRSKYVEEAYFLGAKSYSMLSPVYSLDQIDTNKAIDKLQSFIDAYPNSSYLPEANELVKKLREKLEKKVYENAVGYNKISDYKSAIVALDNFISDYPGTPFKEKAIFYKFHSTYELAINSVISKKEERLNAAKLAYNNLIKFKSDTEYKTKADEMLANIEKELQQFTK